MDAQFFNLTVENHLHNFPEVVDGPILIVASHRTGVWDGVAVGAWAQNQRATGNTLLVTTPRIVDDLPFSLDWVIRKNEDCRKTLRAIANALTSNNSVVVFPEGKVLHEITDVWNDGAFLAAKLGVSNELVHVFGIT